MRAILSELKRISEEMSGSSGHQTQRKDKDLMSDTGGISKNRQKEPEIKPPRTDSHNRYRTKDKTPEQRDPDVDRITKEAGSHIADVSGLRRMSYYVAPGAVEICDRCGAAIRIVAVVEWRDGTKQKYGSECINKILGGDTTLKGLFKKNFNLLRQFQGWLDVLNRPVNQIPKGREYFKSGLYMITDDNGKDIHASKTGAFLFHPDADLERNAVSDYAFLQEGESLPYHTSGKMTYAQFQAKRLKEIEDAKVWLQDQISRLESFLAKVVEKGLIKAEQEGKSVQASGFDSMARSLLARFPQTLREAVQRA